MKSISKIEISESEEDIILVLGSDDDVVVLDFFVSELFFPSPSYPFSEISWTVFVPSANATVTSGAGSDSITITDVKDADVDTGDGDDVVLITHSDLEAEIHADFGYTYFLTLPSGVTQLSTGAGDDTAIVEGTMRADISMGQGSDDLTISFASYRFDPSGIGLLEELIEYSSHGLIDLGGGHDIADISFAGSINLRAGWGHDTISISHGLDYLLEYSDGFTFTEDMPSGTSRVLAGSGNDTVTIEGALTSWVLGGRGDDSITVTHGVRYDTKYDWSSGLDEFYETVATSRIYGGQGNDLITVSDAQTSVIFGGAGSDTFAIAVTNLGNGSNYTVADMTEEDTLVFHSTSASNLDELEEYASVQTIGGDVYIHLSEAPARNCLILLRDAGDLGSFESLADLGSVYDLAIV